MLPQTEPRSINSDTEIRGVFRSMRLSGRVFVGDVGWSTWEEVNSGEVPGANQGWPFFEGGSGQSLVQRNGYATTPEGIEFFDQETPMDKVVAPIYALNHQADGINAIVSGMARIPFTYLDGS